MANKYHSPLQSHDPALLRQVLEGEGDCHALAVQVARDKSGFIDERAVHAFAVTISMKAERVLNTPELIYNDESWLPHDEPLDNIADLHNYARYANLHPMLAFVGLVCLEWDVDGQRVKEILKSRFSTTASFNAVPDYVALAHAVSKEAALSEEERIALGAE